METVSITFNAQQLSIIGEALGNLAYRIADPVVKHINQQIIQQTNEVMPHSDETNNDVNKKDVTDGIKK
ncbi:Uncharacterised protein [Enterobacter hormaechei]|uniref:hypothetical protein n=1 Tax=Enterobacter hormaechei TaxID=158836 RepID=UPI00125533DA|nr:hypothetical protein [Enterobacter hormaechei]VAF77622.1 Uncharacterised protein [Enterobacter hormaechei]